MSRRDLGYVSGYTTVQAFANVYGTASGGTAVTISGQAYQYLAFTSTGSFTATSAGLFDVLLFGGGSGGEADNQYGGGGGSGGIALQTIYLNTGAQTVTIGAGGAGDQCGNVSSIGAIPVAVAAAGGASIVVTAGRNQTIGGMMGRNGAGNTNGATNVQGYVGGTGLASNGGGGGGSTTAVGGNASSNTGGAGGAGYDVSTFIGGSALYKGAGGGGGGATTGGAGGSSVGGAGAGGGATGGTAAANTASGGGGRGTSGTGGAGGSGIVYIRWKV